ncbi:aminotransferase [Staphylococcus warneri]|nr:aminotransferase [Staphylococcus warneri]
MLGGVILLNNLVLNGSLDASKLHNIYIQSADGSFLFDNNSNKFIDLNSGLWNVTIGNDKEFNNEIKKKIIEIFENNLPYLDISSYNNNLYDDTAEKLLHFTNNDKLIYTSMFFTNSGSESVELSYKLTRSIVKDKKIITLKDSYHGTFYGGMALSGITKSYVEGHRPDYTNISNWKLPIGKEEQSNFFNKLNESKSEIGAVFLEPIICSGGIKYSDLSFYNKLMSFCEENNIITIFDEVATGFYKTGKRFFFNHLELAPDILCLSKGINNGTLPSGAVLINKKVKQKLNDTVGEHFSTQNGNLLCIKTIETTLDYYEKHEENIIETVKYIEKIINTIAGIYDVDIRNFGLMTGIPISKKEILYKIQEKLRASKILTFCYETEENQGLLIMPNINIDKSIFEKSLVYIMKLVSKME